MYQNNSHRRRETTVALALGAVWSLGIFFFLLLIGGAFFLSMLVALAVIALVGFVHYLWWGRALDRTRESRHGEP